MKNMLRSILILLCAAMLLAAGCDSDPLSALDAPHPVWKVVVKELAVDRLSEYYHFERHGQSSYSSSHATTTRSYMIEAPDSVPCNFMREPDVLKLCYHTPGYLSDGTTITGRMELDRPHSILRLVTLSYYNEHITNWSQIGWDRSIYALELRDVPYSVEPDGSIQATLTGTAIDSVLKWYLETDTAQIADDYFGTRNITTHRFLRSQPSTASIAITLKP